MQTGNVSQENALEFMLGGNALFTVKSGKSGIRYTYKILTDRKREGFFRVYWMNGSDNTKDFRMLGSIDKSSPSLIPLSIHVKEINAFVALDYIYLNLCVGVFMPTLEIWHEGRCCKCGRPLTVPESIERGIGPECLSKMASNF